MQNSTKKHHNAPPVYTDSDINGLLDTISQLREENQFLLREHDRMVMICNAMRLDILRLRSVNNANRNQNEHFTQQTTKLSTSYGD